MSRMNSRLAFLLTTFNSFLTVFLVGYNSVYAGWWYVGKFVVAMIYRFIDWKKSHFHYFMTEFCYFANLCVLSYFVMTRYGYFDEDPELGNWFFRLAFTIANGPLALAAFTLGDKLVFHDIQYAISLIIHLSPAMLTWSFRWNSIGQLAEPNADLASFALSKLWTDGVRNLATAIPVYLAWFVWYIIVVMIFLRRRIAEKKNVTMYSYLTGGKSNHPINWILNYVPGGFLKQMVYMFIHMLTIIPTMFLTSLWWNSFLLHTAFVMTLGLSSLWHASSYYDYKLIRKENTKRTEKKSKRIQEEMNGEDDAKQKNQEVEVVSPPKTKED